MSATSLSVLALHRSTIGKKVIMAVTGVIWIGFVTFHMYGNLKVFGGPAYFNEYAEGLREFGSPIFGHSHLLWVARLALIGSIVLHVWSAYSLNNRNLATRTTKYIKHTKLRDNAATKTMIYGGTAILLFIIFHLMHFTWGIPGIHPDFVWDDAYHNLVVGFQSYGYVPAILYIIAMVFLALHLYHGTWSMFQTLGLNNKTYTQAIRALAWAISIIVPVGFIIVPLAVMFGIVS